MAIRKVCGIETEYGIVLRGVSESNPVTASSLLINAYVSQQNRKVEWDFEDESPGRDARGFAREGAMAPEVETHLVNAVQHGNDQPIGQGDGDAKIHVAAAGDFVFRRIKRRHGAADGGAGCR